MTDYFKIQTVATYSGEEDFSDVLSRSVFADYTGSADEFQLMRVEADTGGTSVTTSAYSTIRAVIIKNTSDSNSITASGQNAASSAQSQIIPAGGTLQWTDVLASANITLTASGAAVVCDVAVIGT